MEGKRLFDGQCAVCHGIGAGGGTGPSLLRSVLPRAATNADLIRVISNGIENTQMPGAWQMTDHETRLVAAYVRSVGKVEQVKLTGDAARGENIYRKSGCASCHIVDGSGRGYGPELTSIGLRRGANHLRQSITDPAAEVAAEFLTVRLSTRDNRQFRALRVNEDTFTVQVKEGSGAFQSYPKQGLVRYERLPNESLMPAYKLQPGELEDMVAYLAGLRRTQ